MQIGSNFCAFTCFAGTCNVAFSSFCRLNNKAH